MSMRFASVDELRAHLDELERGDTAEQRSAARLVELITRADVGGPGTWVTRKCSTHGGCDDVVTLAGWGDQNVDRMLCGCLRPRGGYAVRVAKAAISESTGGQ